MKPSASVTSSVMAPILLAGFGLLATGCGVGSAGAEDRIDPGGGPLGELVLAAVTEIEVPGQVGLGDPVAVIVRGIHPDGCTTFERFETRRGNGQVDLTAWSFRPLGTCTSPGEPFEATATLEGLEMGVWQIRVNDQLEASVAILAAGGGPPICQGTPTVTIETVVPPTTTHLGGSAELQITGSLPSWCDRLLPPIVGGGGNLLQIDLAAKGCALSAYDPSLCPAGPQPFTVRVPTVPEVLGTISVSVNGAAFGSFEVVPDAVCRFSPLSPVELVVPTRVEAGASFRVGVEGFANEACAALDPIGVSEGAGTITLSLDASVRACATVCAPLSVPRALHADVRIDGLAEGSYQVLASGAAASWPLEVVAPGACAPVSLPDGSVEQVLVTTALSYTDANAGQPIDVSIYGTLPAGCWEAPRITGGLSGTTLELHTESANCATACNGLASGFVASLSFPAGFPTGTYDLTVDGAPFTSFAVGP